MQKMVHMYVLVFNYLYLTLTNWDSLLISGDPYIARDCVPGDGVLVSCLLKVTIRWG